MKRHRSPLVILLLTITLAGCAAMREGMEGHENVVARVDGFTLTIDHAAQLLATTTEQIAPAVPLVVDPLTDLWIGYTLLASEFASPDTFSNVDLRPLIGLAMDQELVWQLHEDVIMEQAGVTESRLRESYEREQPYARVEAQHILVRVPGSASAVQADSLHDFAESLRERLLNGEDFDELARAYSDDPSSASRGGRLDWFERGRLVPEVEEVVFGMQPGEISEVIRSSFGYHVFKVTDRESPDFETVSETYTRDLTDRRVPELEQAYIDSLFDAANVQFTPGVVPLARQLALLPKLERLSPAERAAQMATYRGGALTVGEYANFVIRGSPNSRNVFAGSDSARVIELLREMVRNELLVSTARDQGYTLPETQADSLRDEAVRELYVACTMAGFQRDELLAGDSAITAAVDRVMVEVLTRQRSPRALERVALALEAGHAVQVYSDRFPAVIARLVELRPPGRVTPEEVFEPGATPGPRS
ncbi:MAG: hypothetical protein AMS25_04500 [Gemmatimonas sp. SM23_52]|nr:MAG: hypothetical protein AMS25_04500 [Gemmatimonas sp. SM23_52]